jgi:hypothetical protein
MAITWQYQGVQLPCYCHVIAMLLPCHCHVIAMLLPCYCHDIAMLMPCCCHAIAMLLPCYCHVIAMLCWHVIAILLPSYCHLTAMLLPCRGRGGSDACPPRSCRSGPYVGSRSLSCLQRRLHVAHRRPRSTQSLSLSLTSPGHLDARPADQCPAPRRRRRVPPHPFVRKRWIR